MYQISLIYFFMHCNACQQVPYVTFLVFCLLCCTRWSLLTSPPSSLDWCRLLLPLLLFAFCRALFIDVA
jgi:hypothetical protein